MAFECNRLRDAHFVLGQGAGLVRAEYIDPGQLFDRGQSADDGLSARQVHGPHRERHRKHGRERDRDGRHGQHQGEASDIQKRFVPEERDHQDQHHQHDGNHDEEVADPDHHLLEVALLFEGRLGHQGNDRVEVRRGPRIDDNGQHLALLDDGVGIGRFADLLGDRQRLPGERGLIEAEVIAVEQLHVGRHHVAETDLDDVAGHQLARGNSLEGPFA